MNGAPDVEAEAARARRSNLLMSFNTVARACPALAGTDIGTLTAMIAQTIPIGSGTVPLTPTLAILESASIPGEVARGIVLFFKERDTRYGYEFTLPNAIAVLPAAARSAALAAFAQSGAPRTNSQPGMPAANLQALPRTNSQPNMRALPRTNSQSGMAPLPRTNSQPGMAPLPRTNSQPGMAPLPRTNSQAGMNALPRTNSQPGMAPLPRTNSQAGMNALPRTTSQSGLQAQVTTRRAEPLVSGARMGEAIAVACLSWLVLFVLSQEIGKTEGGWVVSPMWRARMITYAIGAVVILARTAQPLVHLQGMLGLPRLMPMVFAVLGGALSGGVILLVFSDGTAPQNVAIATTVVLAQALVTRVFFFALQNAFPSAAAGVFGAAIQLAFLLTFATTRAGTAGQTVMFLSVWLVALIAPTSFLSRERSVWPTIVWEATLLLVCLGGSL